MNTSLIVLLLFIVLVQYFRLKRWRRWCLSHLPEHERSETDFGIRWKYSSLMLDLRCEIYNLKREIKTLKEKHADTTVEPKSEDAPSDSGGPSICQDGEEEVTGGV